MSSDISHHLTDEFLHEMVTRASASYGGLNICTEYGQDGASSLGELDSLRALASEIIKEVQCGSTVQDETWQRCKPGELRMHEHVRVVTPHWSVQGLVDEQTLRSVELPGSRNRTRLINPETGGILKLDDLPSSAAIYRKPGIMPVPDPAVEQALLVDTYAARNGDIITLENPRLMLVNATNSTYFDAHLVIPTHDVIEWSPVMMTRQVLDQRHYETQR